MKFPAHLTSQENMKFPTQIERHSMKWVMVLSDGETYTSLEGCTIRAIHDAIDENSEEAFVKEADPWFTFEYDTPEGMTSNRGYTTIDMYEEAIDELLHKYDEEDY
jgi:hypothetical protein